MNEKGEGKYNTVLEIFEAMEYGKNFDKVDKAIEWLKSKENTVFAYVEKSTDAPNGIPTKLINYTNNTTVCTIYRAEIDTVKNVLLKCNEKTKWIETPAFERAKMLNKLGDEISENVDLFAQIEAVLRGILTKDTKVKAVPLLAQYFHYYSSFAAKYSQENPKWKPEGIAVGIVSNENSLSNVGLFLAPALAAGYDIVLQADTKIVPALVLLLDLAKKVGIPEDFIRLIPSNEGELLPYLNSEKVAILTLLVNLQNKKYKGSNYWNKKILNFASYKTPVIVFDSADLDSACESIVESAWGYQSLLLWSANTVLVQENIFATFINKLKRKIRSLKVGQPHDEMVDISNKSESNFCKLSSIIVLAQLQGIEVFQTVENADTWSPTLLIGGMVETNKGFSAGDQESNAVTVVAFRSIDEAVNLANNTRQGLAANVWSNNLGIINEVARKLKVGNIWINSSYGLSAADVTLCPMKDSGVGYFGGKEGFYEYVQIEKYKPDNVINSAKESPKITSLNASTISSAKKAQDSWYRISKIEKAKLLQKFAEYVQNNKKSLSVVLGENCLENWISTIYDCITDSNRHSYNCSHSGYNLTSFREPKGVIVIETKTNFNSCQVKLIIMSLFEGNSLIILNDAHMFQPFYKEFSQRLPSGVLNVVPYNLAGVEMAAAHADINAYFGDNINRVFGLLPIKHSKLFSNVTNDWDDVYRKVTVAKNIWCDVGNSSTCNLGSY